MATQSLYRRYRPRRFSEVKGQDHVVKALRTAVAEGRSGQAYLFSGPRGTGKTTSARILAKVLNCERPVGGEPCCECGSCLAVERGTSFDVHELDAASNNGVEAMRDLIEKASLGTPGRHKVYILDEVHMLSKAAEAALLKTLEEPPDHVVFVLATTDPQKMSDTIRSRTQHLQFHLLPADTLEEHVRWVAADAGLEVSDSAIGRVIASGGGSPRDTLSALELVANSGGEAAETVPVGEFIEAMIDQDPGRGLRMIAEAIAHGREPRALTDELIAHLRNGFLSLMAPELVALPGPEVAAVEAQARRLGPPGLVRGIEVLGAALGEMRHAPDPRVLLDVATVQLASASASTDVASLADRVHRLEQRLASPGASSVPGAEASGRPGGDTPADRRSPAPATAVAAPPHDRSTGRAAVGARAKRAVAAAAPADDPAITPTAAATGGPVDDAERGAGVGSGAGAPDPVADRVPTVAAAARPAGDGAEVPAGGAANVAPAASGPAGPASRHAVTVETWSQSVVPELRGMARAVFAPAAFAGGTTTSVTLALPNEAHRNKCEQHRATVEAVLARVVGGPVTLELTIGAGTDGHGAGEHDARAPRAAERAELPDSDDEVDLDDLVDAPPETVKTPIDRLAEAFPGSELIDERD